MYSSTFSLDGMRKRERTIDLLMKVTLCLSVRQCYLLKETEIKRKDGTKGDKLRFIYWKSFKIRIAPMCISFVTNLLSSTQLKCALNLKFKLLQCWFSSLHSSQIAPLEGAVPASIFSMLMLNLHQMQYKFVPNSTTVENWCTYVRCTNI